MRSLCARVTPLALAVGLTFALTTPPHAQAPSWLDKPALGWNVSAAQIPRAPNSTEAGAAILKRCQMDDRRGTAGERAIAAAGWTPFLVFDRELVNGDLEIIGGLAGADGMCRPMGFNVFVFVGGRYAGTLSPAPMDSRTDGTVGAVRILDPNTISGEFSRYTDKDALCCPSSRVSVTYRIDRTPRGPTVTATATREIR